MAAIARITEHVRALIDLSLKVVFKGSDARYRVIAHHERILQITMKASDVVMEKI